MQQRLLTCRLRSA